MKEKQLTTIDILIDILNMIPNKNYTYKDVIKMTSERKGGENYDR